MPNRGFEFIGWVEDFSELLPTITEKTWAIVKTQNKRYWVVALEAKGNVIPKDTYVTATLEGEIYEIQGVTTVIDLVNLVRNPWMTLVALNRKLPNGQKIPNKSLLRDTLNEIFLLEEMGEFNLASNIEKLTKNEQITNKANNFLLKFFENQLFLPYDPVTNTSQIQMLVEDTRATPGAIQDSVSGKVYTDRLIFEDNMDRSTQIRPYEDFAANFKNMGILLNQDADRGPAKSKTLLSAHRAIASSYGYDLDAILDTSAKGTLATQFLRKKLPGHFRTALANAGSNPAIRSRLVANGGDIDFLLNDDNFLRKALGFANNRPFTGTERAFLRYWLKEEEFNLRWGDFKKLPPPLQIGESLAKRWNEYGLVPIYGGKIYYKDQNTPMPIVQAGPLNITSPTNPDADFFNLRANGHLQQDYREHFASVTTEAQDFIVANRAELFADISRHITDNSLRSQRVQNILTDYKSQRYVHYIAAGQNPITADLNATSDTTTYLYDYTNKVNKRTEDIMLGSRYADKLHLAEVYRDVYKSIESGKFLERMLTTRMVSDVFLKPLTGRTYGSVSEALSPIDISKLNQMPFLKHMGVNLASVSTKTAITSVMHAQDPTLFPILYVLYAQQLAGFANETKLPWIMKDKYNPLFMDKWFGMTNPIQKQMKWIFKDGKSMIEIPTRLSAFKDQKSVPLPFKPLKYMPGVNSLKTPYSYAIMGNSSFVGLYNPMGIYDVLETIYADPVNNLFQRYGITQFANISATDMLANLGVATNTLGQSANLHILFSNLTSIEQLILAGGGTLTAAQIPTALMPYFLIAEDLGLITVTGQATGNLIFQFRQNSPALFEGLKKSYQTFIIDGKGGILFEQLEAMGLHPDDRWKLLRNLKINGMADSIGREFTGIIESYNKYANMAQKWFINNFVFNPYVKNVPVLGSLIFGPIQGFLRRLGFSESLTILTTVTRWRWVASIERFGESLHALSKFGRLGVGAGRLSQLIAAPVRFLRMSKTLQNILSLGAKAIAGFGSLVSAGISIIVISFAEAAFKFGINLVKLNPKKAVTEATKSVVKTLKTFAKIANYTLRTIILVCSSCLACFVFFIVIVIAVIYNMVVSYDKYDEYTGPDTNALLSLTVTKTASYNKAADSIDYTITIKNNTNEPVVVDTFTDEMTLTYPCNSNKGTVKYGSSDFIGKVDNENAISASNPDIVGQSINALGTKTIKFKLTGINAAKGTYTNDASVTAKGEEGKYAHGSARTDINEAGCFKCPDGWPSQTPLYVSQGPWAGYSHTRVEAVDLAPSPLGSPRSVISTHGGKVYPQFAKLGVYGNNALVISDDGKYGTLYGHMVDEPNFSQGQSISAGTTLGIMGTTGKSTGVHVHYELRDIPFIGGRNKYQCIAGHPLKLEKIQGGSYVPKTIPDGCQLDGCGGVVN